MNKFVYYKFLKRVENFEILDIFEKILLIQKMSRQALRPNTSLLATPDFDKVHCY